MAKAIIFDLNGVFIQSPPLSSRIAADFGVPVQEFLPVLSEIMGHARKPNAKDIYEYWKPHLARWNIPMGREEFFRYWFEAEQENGEMVRYARELKTKGWKLLILSNNFRERAQHYRERFTFLSELFDEVAFSFETGLVKPDKGCFTRIIERHRIEPEQSFYFDDSQNNVNVARELRFHAHKYESPRQVKQVIEGTE